MQAHPTKYSTIDYEQSLTKKKEEEEKKLVTFFAISENTLPGSLRRTMR